MFGFDLDPEYCEIAARLDAERQRAQARCGRGPWRGATLRDPDDDDRLEFFQARATAGKKAADIAERFTDAGFTVVSDPVKIPKVGVQFNFAEDAEGGRWYVDVSGAFTTVRPGLMQPTRSGRPWAASMCCGPPTNRRT